MGPEGRDAMRTAGRVSAIGLEFAGSVIACLLLGWWLDGKFSTSPWLTLVGIVLGSVAGFKAMYSAAKLMQKQAEAENTPPPSESDPENTKNENP